MGSCASCGAENPAGMRFCGDCGGPLASPCPRCGADEPARRALLRRIAAPPRRDAPTPAAAPPPTVGASGGSCPCCSPTSSASRPLSESRDPEEVRELLSRYFERCRSADRALRRHGREVHRRRGDGRLGHAGRERGRRRARGPRRARPRRRGRRARRGGAARLRARASLTGEAAVTLGAEGQGMVAGDLVNTASRIQSAAEPGTVLVGEITQAGDGSGDRLRGRRRARAQGQDGAGAALSGAARDRRATVVR